ncbi:19587_t:CDS:2 [Entrophospora sp. SA101]|nr:19587_t:CDS:2 [Entrophospora sp. SA101]
MQKDQNLGKKQEVELLSPSSTNGLLDIINNIDKLSPEVNPNFS